MPEIKQTFNLVVSQDELHLMFDAFERVLRTKDIDTISFLAETYTEDVSCRRRIEQLQASLAQFMA